MTNNRYIFIWQPIVTEMQENIENYSIDSFEVKSVNDSVQ
jgi:hypothetical protein